MNTEPNIGAILNASDDAMADIRKARKALQDAVRSMHRVIDSAIDASSAVDMLSAATEDDVRIESMLSKISEQMQLMEVDGPYGSFVLSGFDRSQLETIRRFIKSFCHGRKK